MYIKRGGKNLVTEEAPFTGLTTKDLLGLKRSSQGQDVMQNTKKMIKHHQKKIVIGFLSIVDIRRRLLYIKNDIGEEVKPNFSFFLLAEQTDCRFR